MSVSIKNSYFIGFNYLGETITEGVNGEIFPPEGKNWSLADYIDFTEQTRDEIFYSQWVANDANETLIADNKNEIILHI